jgi:fibronectin-binding autotransporter adhesin
MRLSKARSRFFRGSRPAAFLIALLLMAWARTVPAVDYYWTADGTNLGGSGTWNTTSSLWRSGSATGSLTTFVSASTSQAFLQGTSGTLTTSGTPQFNRITVNSGSFTVSGLVAWASDGTVSPTRAILVNPSTALTITSTNGGGFPISVLGGGTLSFTQSNRNYGGTMTVSTAGTRLIFTAVNGLDNGTNSTPLTMQAGTVVQLNATNNYRAALSLSSAAVEVNSAGAIVFQASSSVSVSGTAASLIKTGTNSAGTIQFNSTRTFTVASTGDPSGVDLDIQCRITGGSGFTKSGTGTMRLSGTTSSYTGATTVSAGKLIIDGDNLAATGTVSVAAGAWLAGSGTTGGALSISGSLSPGNAIGTLTGGSSASFASGSLFDYQMLTSTPSADLLKVSGNLTLTGSVALSLSDLGSSSVLPDGTVLSLVNYGGAASGLFSYGGVTLNDNDQFTFGSNTWQIAYNSTAAGANVSSPLPSGAFVNLVVVPEPSSLVLLALAAVAGGVLCLRRSPTSGFVSGLPAGFVCPTEHPNDDC